jgi:anti-sigma regulatory factor (Ser/Thr protein kinase)
VLLQWRLPALVDTVVVAVSELVTNAIRHGRPQVKLELQREQRQIGVRVHDDEPTEPAAARGRTAADDAESGRGLDIVNALAVEVGVERVPDDGKVVYAYFDTTPRDAEDDKPAT